ncbi:MAG: ABC transporter ATP-binding protein, partial [Microbacteriaceae bacterium]|nr:ABC transporter ATP-binding protein [Microbacteriaceae bacterium]
MTDASVRGTSGEDRDDYTKAESRQIRRRSLRLLGSLISPMRGLVVLTGVVIVVATGLQVLGPLLIAYGINTALPLAVEQMQWMPAIGVTVVYLVTGAAG